jgi:cysteinyl-tRNA synthetase
MIFLYNSLTKKKETLIPIHPPDVGLYTCGPTVYGFPHIGNFRTYILSDLLRRTLELDRYQVQHEMNITDVGHLTDDADQGEDKMIVAMRREGKGVKEIADFYFQAFQTDAKRLNILPPHRYTKATEHIPEQMTMIEQLKKNGFTYQTSDGLYFDTSKLPSYGRLSGQRAEEKKAGKRTDMREKKHATDFALWKFSNRGAARLMEWLSPWGKGFPGWHIECSAMSTKYLGAPFDIHTGGVDHLAVHHENELAQTEGALRKLQANVWMHGEFLTVDGGKMSKSLGNLYTISDLTEKGFSPLSFRYLCLGTQYRTKLSFSWDALRAADNALKKLYARARHFDPPTIGCAEYEKEFLVAINNDLNTPQTLSILWRLMDDEDLPGAARSQSLLFFDRVFGLDLKGFISQPLAVPVDVENLAKERWAARSSKDFARADDLRQKIEARGFFIEDREFSYYVREK